MKISRPACSRFLGFLTAVTFVWQGAIPVHGQTVGTWQNTAAGTYTWLETNFGDDNAPFTPAWGVTGAGTDASPYVLNAIPSVSGDVANLNINIAGDQAILLNSLIALTTLNIGDIDGSNIFTLSAGTGGSLALSGASPSIVKVGTATDTISANVALNAASTINVGTGGRLAISGNITGANSLTKTGAGALNASGASTYSGGTTLGDGTNPAGTVILGSSTTGGLAGSTITSGPLGTGGITFAAGSTPTLQSDSLAFRTLANNITANSNFSIGAAGTGSLMLGGNINFGTGPRIVTVTGNHFTTGLLSGGAPVTIAGTGTLHIRGLNTGLTGVTTLGAGTTTVVGAASQAGTTAAATANAFGSSTLTMGGNVIAADSTRTIGNATTLTGDLTFGSDPRIAGNYDGQVTLSGAMILGGARTFNVITSGTPTLIATNADTISGAISGGSIVKTGEGRLVLSGTNTSITGITISAGVLQFNAAANFGTNPASVAAGAGFLNLNGGVLAFNNAGQIDAPNNIGIHVSAESTIDVMGGTAGNLVMFNNTAATMTGTGNLNKVGTAGFILVGSGTSTWSGNLNIVQGMVMAGSTGTASNGSVLAAVNSIAIQSTAQLRVSNGISAAGNNANRVNDNAAITMNGGFIEFFSPSTGNDNVNYSETLGATTLNRGANGIISDQAGATGTGISTLTISNLIRSAGSTVTFSSGTAFAQGTAGLGQTTKNSLILSQINGAAPVAGFMGGWATVNTAASSSFTTATAAAEWAKYDSTLGVQPFLASDYNGGGAFAEGSMISASYHAKISGGAVATTTLNGNRTVGTLHLNGTVAASNQTVATGTNTLTIDSGGILVTGASTAAHAITGTGALLVGAGNELIVNVAGANLLSIANPITNSAVRLTKSGAGVLTLTGTNSFAGGVSLNQGTLRLAPGPNGTSLSLASSNAINVVNGTIASTGTGVLVLDNNITINDSLTLGDATGAARHILNGNITLAAPTGGIASIIAHTGTTAQINGNISGGSLRIAQVGATGRVALLGNNSFAATDHIRVDSGFLTVGSAGALGSAKIVLNGGGLETGFGMRSAIANDILVTASSTIGGAAHGNPLYLSGTIDLGGTMRSITNDGAGVFTEISGVITNGGWNKVGNGLVIFTNANNNYLGGTTISDSFIYLKGSGVAGANVLGNNITVVTGATGDGGMFLDGPSNLGSNQMLTFALPASTTTGTQALALGAGFSGNSNANPLLGFQNGATGTGTGIMNIRINDIAAGKFLISLNGLTLNQDLIGGPGGTNSAAALTRVWIGAGMSGGTIAGPISAGFGGNYRLGGGLDVYGNGNNQAGVLQVNANVLSGSGTLFIGAEDNVALNNIGTGSVVWMRGAQSNFSGNVLVGAGGILNVAEGSHLGTGNSITLRGGTLRVLNESGLSGYDPNHINTSFAGKDLFIGVGGGTFRHDVGTGPFSNQAVQFGALTMDVIDATAANRTFTISDGGVNSGQVIFSSLTVNNGLTNRAIINVGASFARITGSVTVESGGLEKAGGGTLILDTPNATYIPVLVLNGGSLTLTNAGNFAAGISTIASNSNLIARSNEASHNLELGDIVMSGGNLTMVFGNTDGTGPTSKIVTMASNVITSGANRTLTIRAFDKTTVINNGGLSTATNNLTVSVESGIFTVNGLVTGANSLIKAGRGVLELTGANTGMSGIIQAQIGTLLLSSNTAAGTGAINFTGGSGQVLLNNGVSIDNALNLSTGSLNTNMFGGLSGFNMFNGAFNIGAVTGLTTTPVVANFDAFGTTFFAGVISQTNGGVTTLTKTGDGTVNFTNVNTYGSATAVNNIVQRGTFEGKAQASGSSFGATANSFTLGGGTLKLTGIAGNTSTVHTGALVVGGNNFGGRLVIDASLGGSTAFTVGSLGARAGRGTLVYAPQIGFGETFTITNAPTALNIANGIVAPWFLKQSSSFDTSANFVAAGSSTITDKTYTNGVDQGNLDTLNGANLVLNNTSAVTLTGDRSIYSLRTNSSIDLGTFNLNIGQQNIPTVAVNQVSGLILNNGANITGTGELHMGSSEMNVYVGGGSTSTISARLASLDLANSVATLTNAGLTKTGNGTLVLSNSGNRYMGITTVVSGTLRAGAANVLGQFSLTQKNQASGIQIAAGATFDMSGAGFDQTIGSLAGQGIINLGGNRLIVGNDNTSTIFTGQIQATAGSILLKTGTGVLELSNMLSGSLANDTPSTIYVDQGTLRVHVSDGGAYQGANGDTFTIDSRSAFASGATFNLRGGTLDLRYNMGDVSTNANTLRSGYNVNVLLTSFINTDQGLTGTNGSKQISINNLTLNRFSLTTNSGNTNILQVDGTVTMTENAILVLNSYSNFNGDITDNGNYYTLNKQGGQTMHINSETTFVGGTVASLGRILFGTAGQWASGYEESPNSSTITYNSTAKLGTGAIWLNSFNNTNAINTIRLAPTNLNTNQLLYVRSAGLGAHQTQVEVMADTALSNYNLRSTTGGSLSFLVGPANNSTNVGRWSTALDQQQIGNGRWGFSATTDVVYDNGVLGAGIGSTYRFYGANGGAIMFNRANTLSGANDLVLGQSTLMYGGATSVNSNAIVNILADQSYTGSTTIYRGTPANANQRSASQNTLRVYGDLATSGIENYGRLEINGSGRLTNDAGINVVPLTLRYGSTLTFDYDSGLTSQGSNIGNYLVDVSANTGVNATNVTNKWQDDAVLSLPGSTLTIVNYTTRDTHEVVGGLAIQGLSDINLTPRTNGAVVLELNGAITFNRDTDALRFTGTGFGTAQPSAAAGVGNTRVVFTNGANAPASIGTLTNGATVVSPRYLLSNGTSSTFMGYTNGLGFVPLNPNLTSTGAAISPTTATDYVDLTTTAVTSVAATQNMFLLRAGVGISQAAATAYTINIGGGGLITTAANTFTGFQHATQASAVAGTIAFTNAGPAYIWAQVAGISTFRTNITTNGSLSINAAFSGGAGTIVLAGNNSINGDVVLNGGTLNIYNSATDHATSAIFWNSGAVNPLGGTGANLVLLGANALNAASALPRLELRTDGSQTITTRNLVIGDVNNSLTYAEIDSNRTNATTTDGNITIGGNLIVNGSGLASGSEGTNLRFSSGNSFNLIINGLTQLNARSVTFENVTGDHEITLNGVVSGVASLLKTGGGSLYLANAANTYSGGTYLNVGTLRVTGTGSATATFFGTGSIFVNGGVLEINGANTASLNYATAAKNSLITSGNFQLNTRGATQVMQMGAATSLWQTSNSAVIRIEQTNSNNSTFQWAGGLRIFDNPNFFVNNDQGTNIRGGLIWGNNNASNTFQGNGTIQKTGYGNLTFNFGAGSNTFAGDINVFSGGLRAENTTDKYTSGNINISPGAWIVARANGNATYNPNQVTFTSNSTSLSSLILRGTTDAFSAHLNAANILTGNADGSAVGTAGSGTNGGLLGIEGTYAGPVINMSNVFGGYWFLGGGQLSGTYALASLGAGAADTTHYGAANTGVYRLGGGDATLTLQTTANLLTGANTAVQIGKAWAIDGRGAVTINVSNNYGGGTVIGIARDRNLSYNLAALQVNVGGGTTLASTPLGTGLVEVYGRMHFGGATGAANSSVTANDNAYAFHAGSRLRLEYNEGNTITQALGGKWGDSVGIALNGTSLELNGENNITSTDNIELVGDITFGRQNEIRVVKNGSGNSALTATNLTRLASTYGTMRFTHNASNFGAALNTASNAENFIVTGGVGTAGSGNWAAVTGTGHYSLTNDANMLNPYFISASDNQFMRYSATNGFQTLFTNGTTYGNTYQRVASGLNLGTGLATSNTGITSVSGGTVTFGAAGTLANNGTEILDISSTATNVLSSNLDILALRFGGNGANLNQDATNAFNTIQIRSGGAILNTSNNENTIRANLVFGTAANLVTAYVYSVQSITNLDGQISAADFVKSGGGSVRIAQDQRSFAGKWVVNQGTLEINTAYGLGTNGTNQVLLNGGFQSNTDAFTFPTLQFVTQNGSQNVSGDLSLGTFYHGLITIVEAGQLRFFSANDRQIQIGDVRLETTSTVKGLQPGLLQVQMENSRTIANFGNVTLDDDFVFKIEAATYGPGNTLGMGNTVGARFNNLNNQGLYDITKIGDAMMYLGNISTSFTGGRTFTVNEGAVRVEHQTGSLGAAGTKFIVDNGGAIDIAVAGFNPLGTLIQNIGSIERWSVNGARADATVTLATGVHLQINQSQTGTQTINLTGGSLMGYLAADLEAPVAIRTLGENITINLAANSFLGQIYPFSGTVQYDMGKQNGYVADPLNPRLNGAVLEIKGRITGNFDLTKVGTDVIQLSNSANTYNNTFVKGGTLLLGATNALPTAKTVTTSANGVLDLNGFSTRVGHIAGVTGAITSGATTVTNLNVGGDNENFSYTGLISQGVRVVKEGTGEFTLGSGALSATVTAGSADVTNIGGTGTTNWYVGMPVSGVGIPSGTTVIAVTGLDSATLSAPATASGVAIAPANTNWGGTEMVAGKVRVQSDGNFGIAPNSAASGAANIAFSGGTLRASETFSTAATRGVQVNAAGGTLEVDPTKTLTVEGATVLNGNLSTAQTGGKVFKGVISGSGDLVANGGAGEVVTLQAVNTHTGKVEVNTGSAVNLTGNGSLLDTSWIEVKTGAVFGTNGKSVDGVVSGQGTITGNLVVTSNVGAANGTGVLRPGAASSNSLANAGNQVGSLTINGNLTLAGAATDQTRAVMQVSGATLNEAANIANATGSGNFINYVTSMETTWNNAANGNHDFIQVNGTFSLGQNAIIQIVESNYSLQYGDIIDLFDWTAVSLSDWNNGAAFTGNIRNGGLIGDLNLPTLSGGLKYDLTLFNTSGIVIVVPEPGRALLMLVGLSALFIRRRKGI